MAIPTFNGSAIFDTAVVMNTASNPAQIQRNAYPQVNGVETINLGSRGRLTDVRGYFTAPDVPSLAAKSAEWRGLLESGTVGPLVTTDGTTYPYAYVGRFQEAGRMMTVAGGGVMRAYLASFIHIV
jgi:hypothetical protein